MAHVCFQEARTQWLIDMVFVGCFHIYTFCFFSMLYTLGMYKDYKLDLSPHATNTLLERAGSQRSSGGGYLAGTLVRLYASS